VLARPVFKKIGARKPRGWSCNFASWWWRAGFPAKGNLPAPII
jgi:hypothetical protein